MIKSCKKHRPCQHTSMDIEHALGTFQTWLMYELSKYDDEDDQVRQSEICMWHQRMAAYDIIVDTLRENGLCR